MREIFISYRRSDTEETVGRISEALKRKFGDDAVFKDVDSIAAGRDFREAINQAIHDAEVVLVAIGENWNEERLREQGDFVRAEIQAALDRGTPVIPLLVGGASMPAQENLPEQIGELAFRNAVRIRPDPDFSSDLERLIEALQKNVAALDRHSEELAKHNQNTHSVAQWEKVVAAVVAVFIVGLVSFLVIRDKPFSDPNLAVFVRILLSLSCAVLGAVIPGFLQVDIKGRGLLIRAGGALALFLVTFFFSPQIQSKPDAPEVERQKQPVVYEEGISITYPDNGEFAAFLEGNLDETIFLRTYIDMSLSSEESQEIESMFGIENFEADSSLVLPLEGKGYGNQLQLHLLNGRELNLSSGGSGVVQFELTGYFRVSRTFHGGPTTIYHLSEIPAMVTQPGI